MIKKVLKLSGCSQPLKGWKRVGQSIGGRSYAEKSNLPQLYNPLSFINYHILASDVGPRLVNSIFYSFYNFVLFASMKRRFQVFSLRTGFALRTSFHTNNTVKCEQDLYFTKACWNKAFLPYSWLHGNKIKNLTSNAFSQLIKLQSQLTSLSK